MGCPEKRIVFAHITDAPKISYFLFVSFLFFLYIYFPPLCLFSSLCSSLLCVLPAFIACMIPSSVSGNDQSESTAILGGVTGVITFHLWGRVERA